MVWKTFLPQKKFQTVAVFLGVCLAFFAHIYAIFFWLVIFLTPQWWVIAVAYICFIIFDRNCASCGGRRISFLRNLFIWRYFCSYFPIRLVKTAYLNRSQNYIFAYHPHQMITASVFGTFATNGNVFNKLYPGLNPHLLTLSAMFKFPFVRELYLGFGMCDLSKDSIQYICGGSKGHGNAAVVTVGGASKFVHSTPGSCRLMLKNRKGFVRMALLTGAQLVPVYTFGEDDLCEPPVDPTTSFFQRLLKQIKRKLTIAPVLFYTRRIFQHNFGILPFQRKITTVGSPIHVKKHNNPQQADVDNLHRIYVNNLKELFDRYKGQYSECADSILEIV